MKDREKTKANPELTEFTVAAVETDRTSAMIAASC